VMLTCHSFDFKQEYFVQYPSLIVEVLSKTTEMHDKTFKLHRYKKIPSLQYYLIVSQYSIEIELYSRIEESEIWTYQLFEMYDDVIHFPKLTFSMPVSSIYENITLQVPEE
jgi:Uma2 family endonuclease